MDTSKKQDDFKIPENSHKVKRALYIILIFHMFCIALEVPHFTDIVTQLGGNLRWASILISSRAILSFIFTPILSSMSDEVGRKKILLLGIIGQTISFAVSYLASSVPLLFIARVILGCTLTIPSVGQAYLIDLSRPDEIPKQLSTLGGFLGIGFLLGACCGGLIASQVGNRIPSLIAVFIGIGMLFIALSDLPDIINKQKSSNSPKSKKGFKETLTTLQNLLNKPIVGNILKSRGMIDLSNGILGFIILEYSKTYFGLTPQGRGFLLMYYGVVTSILQMNVTSLTEMMGDSNRFVNLCFYGTIISTSLIPFFSDFWIFILFSTISTTLSYAAPPIIMAEASAVLSASEQGSLMGMGESLVSFGQTVGPLWCGFLIPINIFIPFFSSSLAFVIAHHFLNSRKKQN